jgi:hypothetical protein
MEYTPTNTATCTQSLGTCNSVPAQEYDLHYPDRCHSDSNMFARLEQRLWETWSLTPTAHVKVGGPRAVKTSAIEDAMIAAAEREPWRSHDLLETVSNLGSHKYFMMDSCMYTITWGAQSVCRHSSHRNGILRVTTASRQRFCIIFCRCTNHVLHVRVCSTSTTPLGTGQSSYYLQTLVLSLLQLYH